MITEVELSYPELKRMTEDGHTCAECGGRLGEITEEDAEKEGFNVSPGMTPMGSIGLMSAAACFVEKWNVINPAMPFSFNPWSWRVEFTLTEKYEEASKG